MNALRRAIAGELLSSSSSSLPTKSSLFLTRLQEPSCLYSTATANATSPSQSSKKQAGTKKTTTSKPSKTTQKENPPQLPIPLASAPRRFEEETSVFAELQKKLADLQNGEGGHRKEPSKTTHKENPPQQLLVKPPEIAELQKEQAPPEKAASPEGLNGEGGYRKDLPRPREMMWKKKEANSVNLIGRIQIPVQFEASPDGNYWGGTILSQGNENEPNSAFW